MAEKHKKKNVPLSLPVKQSTDRWFGWILLFFAFLLYSNTIGHEYALDDDIYTKKNSFIQNVTQPEGSFIESAVNIFSKGSLVGFNGSNDSNYRPLVLFNFLIETAIWGNNPKVNHFFNIVFFCITVLLIWKLLKKIFPSLHPSIPFISALLFAAHPIHTEVVANIKSRDEILSFLFCLLSLNSFIDYFDSRQTGKLIFSVIFFFFASLCKESSLTFAFIIPLVIYFFRKAEIKQVVICSIPFVLVAGLYMLMRTNILDSVTFTEKMAVMNNSLMAAPTASEMYATNFTMMGKYLQLLFLPFTLSWDYSYNQFPIVNWMEPTALLSVLIYLALAGYALYKLKDRDLFSFCIIFFFTTIILSSNLIVKIGSSFAERFLYTPSLALCIALPFIIARIFKSNFTAAKAPSTNIIAILTVFVLFFSIKTYSRNPDWKNNFSLFTSGLETSPNSARAHYSYASECRTRGEGTADPVERTRLFNEAVKEFKTGLAIYPESDAYYNLGVTYYNMGDNQKAFECYTKTIELKKDYTPALNNLGVIHFINKNYRDAEKYFKLVLESDTNYGDAYANLGAIFQNEGKLEDALNFYNSAIRKNPRNKNVYLNLSKLYMAKGDSVRSKEYLTKAELIR